MSARDPILFLFEMLVFVLGMMALTAHYWRELFHKDEAHTTRWLLTWMAKGILLPVMAWVALNAGSRPVIPAIVALQPPAGPLSRLGALWFSVQYVSAQTGPALFVISSYWAALTLGWLVWVAARRGGDREGFAVSAIFWCVILSPVVALLLYLYGFSVAGLALLLWAGPLAQHALSLKPVKPVPAYARAIAGVKLGKYRQAEADIIAELEKCESDFDGWLMLAELYARQFGDVGEAARTIHGLCDEPNTTLAQASLALNRLADWQLQFRNDPPAARQALEEIIRRGPGTHLARMAELRIRQLPASREELQERHQPKTIHLPPLGDKLDTAPATPSAPVNRIKARDAANHCVNKLHENPADTPTREKLAAIFADQLGEIGLGIQQIEWLLEMPEQPPEKMAAWLALIASWEIRRDGNAQAARPRLERLVRDYPASVQALGARRRLDLLDRETEETPPAPTAIKPIRLSTGNTG